MRGACLAKAPPVAHAHCSLNCGTSFPNENCRSYDDVVVSSLRRYTDKWEQMTKNKGSTFLQSERPASHVGPGSEVRAPGM